MALTKFSIATCLQIQFLREIAKDIRMLTRSAARSGQLRDGDALAKAQGLFWLWTLGAYEVVRTMAQAKQCFTAEARDRILTQKRHLAETRMPFAKQERAGKKLPVWKEVFAWGYKKNGDIIFNIAGRNISALQEIETFEKFITTLRPEDVILSLPESYSGRAGQFEQTSLSVDGDRKKKHREANKTEDGFVEAAGRGLPQKPSSKTPEPDHPE